MDVVIAATRKRKMTKNSAEWIVIIIVILTMITMAGMIRNKDAEIKELETRIVNPTMPTSEPPRTDQ